MATSDSRAMVLAVKIGRAVEGHEVTTASAIAIFDPESHAVTKLTDGAAPSWSPVEDLIAFLDEAGTKCLTIRPNGSGKKELFSAQGGFFSTGPAAPIFFPVAWSPRGDQLLFHQWADE